MKYDIWRKNVSIALTSTYVAGVVTDLVFGRNDFIVLVGDFLMMLSAFLLGHCIIVITIYEAICKWLKRGNNE